MREWTPEGIERLDAKIREERLSFAHSITTRGDLAFGRGSYSEDALSESQTMNEEQGIITTRLAADTALRIAVRPAPRPLNNGKVSVGSIVTIRYLSDCARMKAGQTETVIQGGVDESDTDSYPPTISRNCPLGRALFGNKVGGEIEFSTKAGSIEATIVEIKIPNLQTAANAA